MRGKKLSALSALVLLCLPMAGCWDAVDINDRDILTAVVVDKTDYGYAFYVEVLPLAISGAQGGAPSGQQQPKIIRSEGRTFEEARANLDNQMEKPVFLGAVQTVIFTDRIASYDIEEYALRLRQLEDYRKTVRVIVTTDDPATLLSTMPEHAQSAGFAIYDTIESLIDQGQLFERTLMDVLERLSGPYKSFSLPTFAVVGREPTFTGMTTFSGGMKSGFVPASDIKPMVFLKSKSPRLMYTVPFNDEYATVKVRMAKKKIIPRIDGEKPVFDMELKFLATLQYPEKSKPVTDEDMAILQATLKAILEEDFTSLYVKSQQELHHDVYNLFEQFQNAFPNEFEKMNWAEKYDQAELNLSVSVSLSSTKQIDYHSSK